MIIHLLTTPLLVAELLISKLSCSKKDDLEDTKTAGTSSYMHDGTLVNNYQASASTST
jgi:hypothetical protein